LAVIESLTQALDAQRGEAAKAREEAAKAREEAAKARKEARAEIARLVTMVEGLTRQLDALLGEKQEERRAELARQREEARALAEAAEQAVGSGLPNGSPGGSGSEANKAPTPNRDEHGRAPKPAHLPRDTNPLKPTQCDACGGSKLLVGKTLVSEEYSYVRAHVRVARTERTICDCADCGAHLVPEQPPMPFDRVSCTFAMMAWLCFAKCGLHLPIDRLLRDFEDQGAPIPSATLTRWWQRGADLLLPVAAAVRLSLLSGTHIRTDGTGLRVVFQKVKGAPRQGPERPGETDAHGYLPYRDPINGQILVFGDDAHAVYHFTEDKKADRTVDFLTLGFDDNKKPILWKGTLTADALNHYDRLFDEDGDRIESGCNAHGLRKFRDDMDKAPLLASRAMGFIGGFYKVEAEAKARELVGAELLAHRQAHAAPLARDFRAWLTEHIGDLRLKTHPVRKAMQYYINHWDALTRFLMDPLVNLDNNWSERALRKIALLRNNSLYAGGIEGAVRVATLLTLINTSRMIGVDPYDYLEWVLTRVVPHSTNRGLTARDLTPAAYKAAQQP